MEEILRNCPGCGRSLGPKASRCFYCGADASSPEPKTGGAFTPVSSTALMAAAVPAPSTPTAAPAPAPAATADPNTHCPICKNPIVAAASPTFSCPSCQSRLECLFASAKSLPGSTARRTPGLAELCINHPTNQAVARCRICRKAVCETCVFKGPTGSYCPECAVKPDEASQKSNLGLSIASLACGVLALMSLGAIILIVLVSAHEKGSATAVGYTFMAGLVLALIGIGTGFSARDGTRKRSMIGLAGIILNLFVLAIIALFVVFALGAKK